MFSNFEFLRLNAGLCLKLNIQLHAQPNKSVYVQLGGSTCNTRESMKCKEKVCSKNSGTEGCSRLVPVSPNFQVDVKNTNFHHFQRQRETIIVVDSLFPNK